MADLLYAQTTAPASAPAGAPAGPPNGMSMVMGFLPWILIFGAFYFLMIMPQNKERKKREFDPTVAFLRACVDSREFAREDPRADRSSAAVRGRVSRAACCSVHQPAKDLDRAPSADRSSRSTIAAQRDPPGTDQACAPIRDRADRRCGAPFPPAPLTPRRHRLRDRLVRGGPRRSAAREEIACAQGRHACLDLVRTGRAAAGGIPTAVGTTAFHRGARPFRRRSRAAGQQSRAIAASGRKGRGPPVAFEIALARRKTGAVEVQGCPALHLPYRPWRHGGGARLPGRSLRPGRACQDHRQGHQRSGAQAGRRV